MLLFFLLLAVYNLGQRVFHGVSELLGSLGITQYHSLSDARSLSPVSLSALRMALSLFGMYSAFPGILEELNKDAPTRGWIQNLQASEASLIFYLKSPNAQKHQETGLPPCHPADLGLGPSEEDRRKWQPTPVFLPGESLGQRSSAGSSPWGHKELDMTEAT